LNLALGAFACVIFYWFDGKKGKGERTGYGRRGNPSFLGKKRSKKTSLGGEEQLCFDKRLGIFNIERINTRGVFCLLNAASKCFRPKQPGCGLLTTRI
jgi:hypothetical protein